MITTSRKNIKVKGKTLRSVVSAPFRQRLFLASKFKTKRSHRPKRRGSIYHRPRGFELRNLRAAYYVLKYCERKGIYKQAVALTSPSTLVRSKGRQFRKRTFLLGSLLKFRKFAQRQVFRHLKASTIHPIVFVELRTGRGRPKNRNKMMLSRS